MRCTKLRVFHAKHLSAPCAIPYAVGGWVGISLLLCGGSCNDYLKKLSNIFMVRSTMLYFNIMINTSTSIASRTYGFGGIVASIDNSTITTNSSVKISLSFNVINFLIIVSYHYITIIYCD